MKFKEPKKKLTEALNQVKVVIEVQSYGVPEKCEHDTLLNLARNLHQAHGDHFRLTLVDQSDPSIGRSVTYDRSAGEHGSIKVGRKTKL